MENMTPCQPIGVDGQCLVGVTYGDITVLSHSDSGLFVCRCACGTVMKATGELISSGGIGNCGCKRMPKQTSTRSRIYTLWRAMIWRCTNPSHEAYQRYGGRGIVPCAEWATFKPFRLWALASGYMDDLSLDRIDNDLGYFPDNCKWSTPRQQTANRRRGLMLLTAFGRTLPIDLWVDEACCSVSGATLRKRLKAGLPPEFSITATESQARAYKAKKPIRIPDTGVSRANFAYYG